jgi:hypothetical protein
MCGTILEIYSEDDGARQSCPSCRRRFEVHLTEEVSGGPRGISLHYLTDGDKATGESTSVGSGTTVFQIPSSGEVSEDSSQPKEPEPPEEAHFKCACGVMLAIPRRLYEKRSRCPACGIRMIVFLLLDPQSLAFTLQLFNLIDRTTGDTQPLTRL